jgi:hypothetical protein
MQKPAIYISRFVKHAVLTLPLVVLSGCGSGPVLKSDLKVGNQQVINYQLATTQLTIRLREQGGVYAIEIEEPRYVGDPRANFKMNYSGSPFAEDDFTVEVDSKTRLLKRIQFKTTEKSDDIFTKAVESITALESSPVVDANSGQVLLEVTFYPEIESDLSQINKDLEKLSKHKIKNIVIEPVGTYPTKTGNKNSEHDEYPKQENKPMNAHENASASNDSSGKSAKVNGESSECSLSVCYRTFVPYKLSFNVEDIKFSKVIYLTKPGNPEGLSLDRTPFVEKVTNITFVDGAPTEVAFKKPSEALELVALPLTIAKAILKVPTELIKLKIDLSDQEKALADKEKARIEAESNLKKARLGNVENGVLNDFNINNKKRVLMFAASGPWGQAAPNGDTGISKQTSPGQVLPASAIGAGERESPTPAGGSRRTGR